MTENECYENLANAIIMQAVKDYKNGYDRERIEKFIGSEWFKALTNVPPEVIMKVCHDDTVSIKNRDEEATL